MAYVLGINILISAMAIKVPVLPTPALQWMTTFSSFSKWVIITSTSLFREFCEVYKGLSPSGHPLN
jgi:hypothetical protein